MVGFRGDFPDWVSVDSELLLQMLIRTKQRQGGPGGPGYTVGSRAYRLGLYRVTVGYGWLRFGFAEKGLAVVRLLYDRSIVVVLDDEVFFRIITPHGVLLARLPCTHGFVRLRMPLRSSDMSSYYYYRVS